MSIQAQCRMLLLKFLLHFIHSFVCACALSCEGQRPACGSQFSLDKSQRSDSGLQAWWQLPLPAELSCWSLNVLFELVPSPLPEVPCHRWKNGVLEAGGRGCLVEVEAVWPS